MIHAGKIADGRFSLPARSGCISEYRGTIMGEESSRGRVQPAVLRTRQGESGRRPISCAFTLQITRYPAVSLFDHSIYPVVSFTLYFSP